MDDQPQRVDPIGRRYFAPLSLADRVSNIVFFVVAILSFLALLVERDSEWYALVQSAFIIGAMMLFVISQLIRLYLWPRAGDKRREEFLSNTLQVDLTHEKTTGYYNNDESNPIRRMGMAVLENTHFTRAVASAMARRERFLMVVYTSFWLAALINRNSDLGWIAVAAQVLFSEQVVARWLRVEWLRMKSEKIHDELRKVFGSRPKPAMLRAYVLDAFVTYEATKENAAIVLSSKIFFRMNTSLSEEWESIKTSIA